MVSFMLGNRSVEQPILGSALGMIGQSQQPSLDHDMAVRNDVRNFTGIILSLLEVSPLNAIVRLIYCINGEHCIL